MRADVLVVTPWYPTATRPFYGAFVTSWVAALQASGTSVEVLHLDNTVDIDAPVVTESTTVGGAPLTHVAVPQPARASRAVMAQVQADVLRDLWAERYPGVERVHAHVGMPTGWAVATTLPPDVRLVLTEHASYLNQVFRDEQTAQMYSAAVARSSACLAVSARMADLLRPKVGAAASRVGVLGNPVDFTRFPLLDTRRRGLRRWLYVGNLLEAKGVMRVLEAFARADTTAEAKGELTLTFVGDGPMRDALAARAEELGVAAKVTLRPGVPAEEVPAVYAEHDVLVHLSTFETFGLTTIEAVASGLHAVVTRCGGPEDTVLHASEMGAVRYVVVSDDPKPTVDAWLDLVRRVGTVDWPSVRLILEQRFSPLHIAERLRAALNLPAADARSAPLRLTVLTLDPGGLRRARQTLSFLDDLGVEITTRSLTQARGVAAEVQRLRVGHAPRALTEQARAAILAEDTDLVAVDTFVGAALVGRSDGLPPVVSLGRPERLWRGIAGAIRRTHEKAGVL